MSPAVSVIIPTLDAEDELSKQLAALKRQTLVPAEIIVVDSASNDSTQDIAGRDSDVTLLVINREDFNHGTTREMAFRRSIGEYVCFLTQDALPSDERYFENLLKQMIDDDEIALAYARQIPKGDARRYIELVQQFNYPDKSHIRDKHDLDSLGIKTYFCSDSCSAYRRSALEGIGGIPSPCSTNEDMLAAARFIKAGYKIAYSANAKVIHSHNLTFYQQFKRNRAIGAFLKQHSDELNVSSEVKEGERLAGFVCGELISEHRFFEVARFGLDCVARYLGNLTGKCFGR